MKELRIEGMEERRKGEKIEKIEKEKDKYKKKSSRKRERKRDYLLNNAWVNTGACVWHFTTVN